jgi:hypothetical protein
MGETRNAHTVLVGKLELKKPLERPNHRRENITKIYFKEMGYQAVDYIHLET